MLRMYDLVSFVTRGKVRVKVLRELSDPKTPTKLAPIVKTHRSTVSRAILSLERKGLVKCITPKEKIGRYYQITEKGKLILKKLG